MNCLCATREVNKYRLSIWSAIPTSRQLGRYLE